jgi:hypothetical protein
MDLFIIFIDKLDYLAKIGGEQLFGRSNLQLENNHPIRPGTSVRIRSEQEIINTLDDSGCVDGILFMPEMRGYCGGVYIVLKCVNRILIEGTGVRGLSDVFILEGIRCDGSDHGECQRLCHIFWKACWLDFERIKIDPDIDKAEAPKLKSYHGHPSNCQGQASILLKATHPVSVFNPEQYLQDKQSGTRSLSQTCVMLLSMAIKRLFWCSRKIYRWFVRRQPKTSYLTQLLQPGDLVKVRSRQEVKELLDWERKTQGLLFAEAMWHYCGKQFRVVKEVKRIVVEQTGVLQKVRDTYLLEGVTCDGEAFRGCPRMCFWFWKGVWLQKVDDLERQTNSM